MWAIHAHEETKKGTARLNEGIFSEYSDRRLGRFHTSEVRRLMQLRKQVIELGAPKQEAKEWPAYLCESFIRDWEKMVRGREKMIDDLIKEETEDIEKIEREIQDEMEMRRKSEREVEIKREKDRLRKQRGDTMQDWIPTVSDLSESEDTASDDTESEYEDFD